MRQIKLNQVVQCPADMGTKGYSGIVVHVEDEVKTNIYGLQYQWVTVQDKNKISSIWPSHRLR